MIVSFSPACLLVVVQCTDAHAMLQRSPLQFPAKPKGLRQGGKERTERGVPPSFLYPWKQHPALQGCVSVVLTHRNAMEERKDKKWWEMKWRRE